MRLDDSASEFSSLCTPIPVLLPAPADPGEGLTPAPTVEATTQPQAELRSSVFAEVEAAAEVCPVCGKVGAAAAHVKACGARLGLTPAELVGARRLGERQQEERRALGLPPLPAAKPAGKPKPRAKKKVKEEEEGGADPDLALALALSISAQEEEEVTSKYWSGEGKEVVKVKEVKKADEVPEQEGRMWLPRAQKSPKKKRRRKKDLVGPTALQCRTEEERARMLGERVAAVLVEVEAPPLPRPRVGASVRGAPSSHYWSLPARLDALAPPALLARDIGQHFTALEVEEVAMASTSSSSSLATLSSSWLGLLASGAGRDTVVVCRGEEELPCHALVLATRCPALLAPAVVETAPSGATSRTIVLSEFGGAAVRVLLKWVYGGVFEGGAVTSREVLGELRALATRLGVVEVLSWLEEVQVQEDGEEQVLEGDGFALGEQEVEEGEGERRLDALLSCLEEDEESGGEEEQRGEEMEEWDSVCQYMTQRARSTVVEEEESEEEEEEEETSDSVFKEDNFDAKLEPEDEKNEDLRDDYKEVPITIEDSEGDDGMEEKKDNSSDKENMDPDRSMEASPEPPLHSTSPLKWMAEAPKSPTASLPPPAAPSPDMFDSEEEQEEEHGEVSGEEEHGAFDPNISQKRKSFFLEDVTPKRSKVGKEVVSEVGGRWWCSSEVNEGVRLRCEEEELPTPTKYSPLPPRSYPSTSFPSTSLPSTSPPPPPSSPYSCTSPSYSP